MATKARFYEMAIENVHGIRYEAHAAYSEDDLRNNLEIHHLEKLVSLTHLGFFSVEAEPDDENDAVIFSAALPRGGWSCYIGDFSYPHLLQQFSRDVGNIKEYFRQRDESRYGQ